MPNKLDWKGLKQILNQELLNKKHILTFGTLGSHNLKKDIDIIVTKKKNSHASNFYREIHQIWESVDKKLQNKYSRKLIVFSGGGIWPENKKISEYKKEDIFFDIMPYVSLKEMESDWNPYLQKGLNVRNLIEKECSFIRGNAKDIFSNKFKKSTKNDNLFLLMMKYDKIHTKYPKKFLIECMNEHFNSILRKILNSKVKRTKNLEEAKEIFYQILDKIENRN